MAQEELYTPNPVTRQGFGHLCRHALRFGKMFGSDVCGLETFAIVSSFLYVSDRRAEQSGTVLLRHRKQGDFTIKLDELFDDQFLDITPASFATVVPSVFQVFGTFCHRLAFAR